MMPHDIIPCQTFSHITTQWCHMESLIFKHLFMSQPNDAIWHLSSIKIAIQQQALHTSFLANKEIYGSKSTVQTLWQKQSLEKTN